MKEKIDVGLNNRGKLLVLAAAFILSLNVVTIFYTSNRIGILLSFSILAVILSDWMILRLRLTALEKLEITREFDQRTYDNKPISISLKMKNTSIYGLYTVEIDDRYPTTSKLISGKNRGVINIPPRAMANIKYTLSVEAVGKHRFEGLYMRIRDLLGIFTVKALYTDIKYNEIYCSANIPPVDIRELARHGLKILSGPWTAKKIGFSQEFKEIREYRPGDEVKRIDWKASARSNKLMIRDYETESQTDIVIILDLSKNMFLGELGIRKYDYSTRTIAFIINYAIRCRDRVGALILESDKYHIISLRPATRYTYREIMEILSKIDVEKMPKKYRLTELHFGKILPLLKVKEKTLFIVISDLEDEERARIILSGIKTLRKLRHEVVLISPLTPLFEMPMVSGINAALYRVETYKSIKERERIKSELIKVGIPVVNVGPEDLIPAVLTKLEEFRRVTPS